MNIPIEDSKSHGNYFQEVDRLGISIRIFDQTLSFDMSEDKVLMSASGDEGSMTAKLSLKTLSLLIMQ